jgi:hypothetical protein
MNRSALKPWLLSMMAAIVTAAAARAEEPKAAAAPAPAAAAPAAAAEPAKPAAKWYDELQFNAFVSASYIQNLSGARTNGLRVFDANANTFSIGVAELVLQKPVANAGDVGFRFDMDFGGLIPGLTVFAPDPVGLRQAFASYIAPVGSGLRIDVGKFVTLHGFEYIETFDNPNDNYSRSLLFGYAIPFTHTGAQFSYTFSPKVKAVVQIVNGWDAEISAQNGKTGCAQVNVTPTDTTSVYLNYCGGIETVAGAHLTRHLVDLNGTVKVTPWLTLGVNGDYGTDVPSSGDSAAWYGAALYVKGESESGMGLALRGEYFNDDKGARTGTAGAVSEVTVTPYIKINSRLLVRLEGRVDIADSEIFKDGQSGAMSKTQATVALNTAFTY